MLDRYREVDLSTASPEILVLKMYEGALRFARQAAEFNSAGRIGERGRALSRALAIVSELRTSLDFEQGGEIALNLESLYNYVSERLLEANLRGESGRIQEAINVLEMLREAWQEIARPQAEKEAAAK